MKNTDKNKGFTLIELLVVIAVIGILAGVITASIFTSKNKGADGGIKREIQELRSQAEIYYLNNNNKYYVSATDNVCVAPVTQKYRLDPLLTKLASYYKPATTVVTALGTAQNATTNLVVCHVNSNNTGYAISAKLQTPTTPTYYCIDNRGNRRISTNSTTPLAANSITCP
jgi:prepilin-type N-terminal cleavage/methylation domain-containing protein